jgi:hypothetical protein
MLSRRRGMAAVLAVGLVTALGSPITGSGVASGATNHAPVLAGSSHPLPSATIPTVTGPITGPGSPQLLLANYPLSKIGYSESEYFFSGTATSYSNVTPLTSNGEWSVQPAATAAYKSRLVVVMPTDRAKFNGTVVVEWFNVSGGSDGAPDWSLGHDEMIRSGDAYVGVSAQAVGINELQTSDPARYGSLVDPGDSFSYDMFSQAGMAVRAEASILLPGLRPTMVIAAGESQSAIFMTTYVDAVAPLVNVFDSYLIDSRSGGSAPLSQTPQAVINTPPVVFIRTDQRVPVLTFLTETDVLGILDFYPATQPDSRFFSLWETAGTAHGDTYLVTQAADDDTSWGSDLDQFASLTSPPSSVTIGTFSLSCPVPFNAGEQQYVFHTALHDLVFWTRTGVAPEKMPLLQVDNSTTPPRYRLDSNGNVLGGIRTPAVDAPLATLSGLPPTGAPGFCLLFGQTTPFTPSQISALYPTHQDFVRQWQRSAYLDQRDGYLLPQDAKKLAEVVSVPQ